MGEPEVKGRESRLERHLGINYPNIGRYYFRNSYLKGP